MFFAYFDESGDDGFPKYSSPLFSLSAIYFHNSKWRENFEKLQNFRKSVRDEHGLLLKVSKLDDLTPSHYRGFIDDALIDRVEKVYSMRARRRENSRPPLPDFVPPLFYRLIFCPLCGMRFVIHRKTKYYYYRHGKEGHCANRGQISMRFLDPLCWELPPIQRLLSLTDDEKHEIAQRATEHNDLAEVEEERRGITTQLGRLEDTAIDELLSTGIVSAAKFQTRRDELTRRLADLPATPHAPLTFDDYLAQLNDVSAMLARVRELDPHLANNIMRSLFAAIRVDVKARSIVGYDLQPDVARWMGNDKKLGV